MDNRRRTSDKLQTPSTLKRKVESSELRTCRKKENSEATYSEYTEMRRMPESYKLRKTE
jgi:hypothetical protein